MIVTNLLPSGGDAETETGKRDREGSRLGWHSRHVVKPGTTEHRNNGTPEQRNTGTPEQRNTSLRNNLQI